MGDDIKKKYHELGIDLDSKDINLRVDLHADEGSFDYDSYVEAQTDINVLKLDAIGDGPRFKGPPLRRMQAIGGYIKAHIPDVKFGICHGTRTGKEQRDISDYLNSSKPSPSKFPEKWVKVIGTEISYTAAGVANTIQWDFHDVKKSWVQNVCFIFSNSLDHSYDPIKALQAWMSCIKPNGKIFIQRSESDRPQKKNKEQATPEADIFQASEGMFLKIVDIAGKGLWSVKYPNRLIFNADRGKKYIKKIAVLERK